MAVHDNREFEQLFVAYANGELTREEHSRLLVLVGQDVGRRGALAEMDAVHEVFAVEAGMRSRIQRPVEPIEEADESYQRLVGAAARAETGLRATLEQSPVIDPLVVKRAPRQGAATRVWAVALAAVVFAVVSLVLALNPGGPPPLDGSNPGHNVLGNDIVITPSVTADSPWLSWGIPHADAVDYQAVILDAQDEVVLQRATTDLRIRRATTWALSEEDLQRLRQHRELFLRVVAFDKAGVEVARTTGKKPIDVR